jgi:predicted ATP-dependent serine protease
MVALSKTKAKKEIEFLCTECGNTTPKWAGKCPFCGAWSSLKEHVVENILESISKDPSISTKELAGTYSLSERQVQRIMTRLKDKGIIRRVGPDKGGHWEIIKS